MANSNQVTISIRQARAHDNKLLAELGAETFYDSFAVDNTPENVSAYLATSFSPEKQAAELADPNSKFLIAEIEGEVSGYARVKFGDAPPEITGQQPMEIARFYARKRWIGQGVGAQLMRSCLNEARNAGCDVVWLGVWEKNRRAITFYRKWGFVEVGAQTFRLGDDLQHDLIMARTVA
ncbi:MAG TPA: GNAT family N-acetyltransferase [Anaerolineae bacterium]